MRITKGSIEKIVTPTSIAPTQIKCSLPLTGLPSGDYEVWALNTDGTKGKCANLFTVTNPSPVITTISPVSGYNSDYLNLTISGSKFVNGLTVSLKNGGTTLAGTVSSFTLTKFDARFDLRGASTGSYNLEVTNPDCLIPATGTFTVLAPGDAPVISGISPSAGYNTATLPVTITGSKFNKPTVYLNQGSLTKVSAATPGKTSTATMLYVTLPLTGVPGGLYDITVKNSDGVSETAMDSFYVNDQSWIVKPKQGARSSPVVQHPGVPSTGMVLPAPQGRMGIRTGAVVPGMGR